MSSRVPAHDAATTDALPAAVRSSYLRVGAAVPLVRVGDISTNVQRIAELIDAAASEGVSLVAFPELALCGYTIADLVHQRVVLDRVADALIELAERTAATSTTVILGAPVVIGPKLYNVAAVLSDGRLAAVIPKRWLPNYGEFYERRWFASADSLEPNAVAAIAGVECPADPTALLEIAGATCAVEVCEDMWAPIAPSSHHALAGAECITNISASNELLGKADWRRTLLRAQSGTTITGYVYVSSGVGESSADTTFGGHAVIAENGSILAETPRFSRDPQLLIGDLDIAALRHDRMHNTSFMPDPAQESRQRILLQPGQWQGSDLRRPVDAHPFVPSDSSERRERCEEILSICAHGLATAMTAARCEHLVLGVSGGLDSTLAAIVAVRALEILGLDRSKLHALVMPGMASSDRTQSNAEEFARLLGASVRVVTVSDLSAAALAAIGHDGATQDITYENTQARLRTLLLMNTANLVGGLVVGTGDLSELALGWCTFNGDHMSMYNVNVGVPKTLVRHVVATAADWEEFESVRTILADILDTPISPELTLNDGEDPLSQRTEDIVGPYELNDFFLYRVLRFGDHPKKIQWLAEIAFDGTYDGPTIAKWRGKFFERFTRSQFKRDALPNGPKVGTVALSPRADWRMSPQAGAWYASED